jgi:23S rRNA (cytosine1962-C5)-methyltransferase
MNETKILSTKPSTGYELLDSGEGEKIERWGDLILRRPDPQALWKKKADTLWKSADAVFVRSGRDGKWQWNRKELEKKEWQIDFSGLRFNIKPTAFKHTGLFPEQEPNWEWVRGLIHKTSKEKPLSVINLFGYTGGATLSALSAGATVTHVDSSKSAVTWARTNAELSGVSTMPVRWIVEDVRVFVKREINRGNRYDGIIMDPPAFGHGAKKELWKIEDDLISLIDDCMNLLSDNPSFFIVNGYSSGYSPLAYQNSLSGLVDRYGGKIEVGELTIAESNSHGPSRLLPAGIFARWSRN